MAPAAVIANGVAVHIGVTARTTRFCFRKYQRAMTASAISRRVLPLKRKTCLIMRENLFDSFFRRQTRNPTAFSFRCLPLLLPKGSRNFPAVGRMAYSTVQLQTIPVRVLSINTADTKQYRQADDYYTRQFNGYRCVDKPISLIANGHLTR